MRVPRCRGEQLMCAARQFTYFASEVASAWPARASWTSRETVWTGASRSEEGGTHVGIDV